MSNQTWFRTEDILSDKPSTIVDDIYGYVLPHASTAYTGEIISHTLQFKPSNIDSIRRVYIYYYPANNKPDITIQSNPITDPNEKIISIYMNNCHHELYVPFCSILHYFRQWKINIDNIRFIPVNVRKLYNGVGGRRTFRTKKHNNNNTNTTRHVDNKASNFYIISADFSHHKPFQYAIMNENKAAHAIVTTSLSLSTASASYLNEIDDIQTFRFFLKRHKHISFQWVGRTRSPGESAVGYLSFLVRPIFKPNKQIIKTPIDGIFVTCYDVEMNARECLGKWYSENNEVWSQVNEDTFISEVLHKARTTSRLTGGQNTNMPVTRCVITYLFKDTQTSNTGIPTFIRGWHSIRTNAIYLPDVLLEHAKEDGTWITPKDTEWAISDEYKKQKVFDLSETLTELDEKANNIARGIPNNNMTLYTARTRIKN
jgi:hypothetical protein